MNILFLVPYPTGEAPSQRFRYEQYLDILKDHGHTYSIKPFWNNHSWHVLYTDRTTRKVFGLVQGLVGRISCLFYLKKFDCVFVHREATPLGPPFMEWVITRFCGIPLIYDFDDSIWLPDNITNLNFISILKFRNKVNRICGWSHKISCGNSFLANYARKFNSEVIINPTTIDTQNYHIPQEAENLAPVIGWTGTHTTLPYLDPILPLLTILSERFDFIFKVICNQEPKYDLPGFQFVEWNKKKEISELNSIDIGIMPLPNTEWAKGKCGFKVLQYMALEKATVASSVGVNSSIITHGHDGLLCSTESDWLDALEKLLESYELRRQLGKNGRTTVERSYSLASNQNNFLKIFS